MRKPHGIAVSVRPMDRFEVEDAARTIARAEEHKRNPKLMKAVRAHVQGLHKAVGLGARSPKMPRR
jgi:hypothetical protein